MRDIENNDIDDYEDGDNKQQIEYFWYQSHGNIYRFCIFQDYFPSVLYLYFTPNMSFLPTTYNTTAAMVR